MSSEVLVTLVRATTTKGAFKFSDYKNLAFIDLADWLQSESILTPEVQAIDKAWHTTYNKYKFRPGDLLVITVFLKLKNEQQLSRAFHLRF